MAQLPELPPAAPLKVTDTVARRSGKTALHWHRLRQESAAAGRAIVCVRCERPHLRPPLFGCCPCGSYAYGIKSAEDAQPSLPLEECCG